MPRVCVGSTNKVKIQVAQQAFEKVWPDKSWEVYGCEVASGVSEQPRSEYETMSGAFGRVSQAIASAPGIDYAVGMERGLKQVDSMTMECGWIAVVDREGRLGWGSTANIMVPRAFRVLLSRGMDLNQAIEKIFGITGAGSAGGYFGVMTNNALPWREAYRNGTIFALARFVQAELFDQKTSFLDQAGCWLEIDALEEGDA